MIYTMKKPLTGYTLIELLIVIGFVVMGGLMGARLWGLL